MASAWITEYDAFGIRRDTGTGTLQAQMPLEPGTDQTPVTFTTATQSAAFAASTRFVRIITDADCHVLFGANPTATANHQKLIAGVEYWRAVSAGDKVSIYDGTS